MTCFKTSSAIKKELAKDFPNNSKVKDYKAKAAAARERDDDDDEVEMAGGSGSSSSSSSSRKVDTYMDSCNKERAEHILMLMITFIVGCGLSFAIVENPFFLAMLAGLNTAFIKYMVKTDTFKKRLLPALYKSTKAKMMAFFELYPGRLRTLCLDGATDVNSETKISVVESLGEHTAFKNMIQLGK